MGKFSRKNAQGFTIVELLIVIVVIGILAAITIVAYGGITAKANTVKAQTNAANVQKVAEVYNADKGSYPADGTTLKSYTGGSSSVPSGIAVLAATSPDGTNGLTTVGYYPKGTTGGCIVYYNFSTSAVVAVFAGNATTFTVGSPSTCS